MIFQRIPGMKKHAWNTQALRKNSSISFTDAGIHIHRMQCLSLWQETALEAFLITILICFNEKTDKYLRLQIKQCCLRQWSWKMDERDKIIIRPASTDAKDGLAVAYRNGKFDLYTSAKTELFDCVYETEDIDEMAGILDGMLNRKFERGTVAIVPLSKTAIAIMDKRGDCYFLCEGEDRTDIRKRKPNLQPLPSPVCSTGTE